MCNITCFCNNSSYENLASIKTTFMVWAFILIFFLNKTKKKYEIKFTIVEHINDFRYK